MRACRRWIVTLTTGSFAIASLAIGCLDFGSLSGSDAGSSDSAVDGTPGDAIADSSVTTDASDGGGCDPTKPFGTPTVVGGLPIDLYNDVRVSDDELSAYFNGDGGLFVATRPDRTSSFGAGALVKGLPASAYDPSPAADQRSIYFVADDYLLPDADLSGYDSGGTGILGGSQIFAATRSTPTDPFASTVSAFGGEIFGNNRGPFYFAPARELWISSDRSGSDDIFRAAELDAGGFQYVTAVPELSTPFSEAFPYISDDGKTIGFSTDRTDGDVKGGYDIWTAQRATIYSSFSAPTPETALNTSGNESMSSFSADGCRIYYLSEALVYSASRPN